jgi:hypothetical protein
MKSRLRRRFWAEAPLSVLTAVVLVVTLVQRDWIESLLGIDPDQHSGALEWLIFGVLLVATLTLGSLASYELRRGSRSTAGTA